MKLLFITFYYPPDLSAGSFRASSLIDNLGRNEEIKTTIITTQPNRYASFKKNANSQEERDNIKIVRINLPNHKNQMLDQAISFLSFYSQALKIASKEKYDAVFATSSRLFSAFLGARIAKKKNIPLYLDIRDLFIDTMSNMLHPLIFSILKPLLFLTEQYTFKTANHINLVSEGFNEYMTKKYPKKSISFYTNGIDSIFIDKKFNIKKKTNTKEILYAGNIGTGQGLEKIIPKLATKLIEYDFKIIGDGGSKKELIKRTKNLPNVKVMDPLPRNELLNHYINTDILLMHLNDMEAFEKVLPSKIFEYAATGKPMISGIAGYAKKFQEHNIENSATFKPCDEKGAIQAIHKIKISHCERENFIKRFSRDNIAMEMTKSIVCQLSK